MISKTTNENGRLGNLVIRNLCLSILAKKYDLCAEYYEYNNINNILGIELFTGGSKKYNKTIRILNSDFMKYLKNDIENNANFDLMDDYFQNEEITNILHKHLINNMKNIIDKNPFKERYNNNNDVFLHIRLSGLCPKFHDNKIEKYGLEYYTHCINLLKYDNIYIASDDFNHDLIKKIKNLYPKVIFIEKNEVETIQFGSTCKNIILSHGTFSAIIVYLGFYSSNIYFLNKEPKWHPIDIFINKGFIPIDLN